MWYIHTHTYIFHHRKNKDDLHKIATPHSTLYTPLELGLIPTCTSWSSKDSSMLVYVLFVSPTWWFTWLSKISEKNVALATSAKGILEPWGLGMGQALQNPRKNAPTRKGSFSLWCPGQSFWPHHLYPVALKANCCTHGSRRSGAESNHADALQRQRLWFMSIGGFNSIWHFLSQIIITITSSH